MPGRIHVGIVGFRHPHWVGDFYPRHPSDDALLRHYARRFTALEVPLEAVPDMGLALEIGDDAPRMVVTLPAPWIHLPGRGLPFHPGLEVLEVLATSGALAGVHLPLPGGLPPTREHAVRLRRLAKVFADQGLIIDLPGGNWRGPAVHQWLDRIAVCTTWFADPASPTPPATTGPTGLVRIPAAPRRLRRHGDSRLQGLVPGIRQLARTRAEVLVLFTDCGLGAATVEDARDLIRLLLAEELVVGGRRTADLAG